MARTGTMPLNLNNQENESGQLFIYTHLGKDLTIRLGGITFLSFGLFSGLLAYIVK